MKKLTFLVAALCACTMSWAAEIVVKSLDTTGSLQGKNSNYASSGDVESDGITWNVAGNTQQNPWRIGGKSLEGTDRAVYTKTAIAEDITKIEVSHGAASGITVNSFKLLVAGKADFSDAVEYAGTFTPSAVATFTRPAETSWANKYYKLVYNVTVSDTKNKFIEFNGVTFYTEVVGAPEAPTFSVAEGLYTSAQSVELTCATEGASIYYTLDGSTPDKSATLYSAAIPVSKTTTIKAVAIKDDIASSIVSATYTFPEEVADLAAFIAKADKENYVRILSECVVTYQLDEKNVYVQDASAGMLIYLKTGGLATYKAGDRLTGIIGKFTTYKGQNQLAPALEAMPTPVAGDALTPAAVTISEVVADIQNQYIKLSSVSFKEAATFETGKVGSGVNITDGTKELVLYNKFTIMNGTYAASKKYDIVGIAVLYSTSSQEYMEIFPISVTEQSTTAIESVEMSNIYAHSGRIYGAEQGRIYTINGMDVTEQNGQLSNGIYIVKVGATATKIAVK